MKKIWILAAALCTASFLNAQDIVLPKVDLNGGKKLMQCLKERRTTRNYTGKELSAKQLSGLFYAAYGINRPAEKKRTIATARNWQDLTVYAVLKSGIYRYDAEKHALLLQKKGDFRAKFGRQAKMFAKASVVLIYVSDYKRLQCPPEDQLRYSAAHAGSAYQNVYLYAASENLGSVAIGLVNRKEADPLLKLSPDQKIVFAQLVGTL